MRVIKIPKGEGRFRTIFAPDEAEKKRLLELLPGIAAAARIADSKNNVAHGFREGRSPLTNAKPHVGYKFTLTADLRDFFDSVTAQHVPIEHQHTECFLTQFGDKVEPVFSTTGFAIPSVYVARQGLPTSPALANLAAAPMDDKIMALRQRRGRFHFDFVYTRYADDMAFSFDEERIGAMLKREVPLIVESFGFQINPAKTKMQSAKCGRRIITGIAVGDTDVYPTRYMRRRLRAARHQRNTAEARGLAEWMRLRMPKAFSNPVRRLIQAAPKPVTVTRTGSTTITPATNPTTTKRKFDLW